MSEQEQSISLCMIVKNEADMVGKAISSVSAIVREVIVVDTGSSDTSKEICIGLGAKVFEYPWADDFSGPRNFSLEKASADWILVLDADEIVHESDHGKFAELMQNPSKCYLFPQRHYVHESRFSGFTPCDGSFPEREANYPGYFESWLCRFFPNFKGISYRGRVHELVEASIAERPDLELTPARITLHHYGHVRHAQREREKADLYVSLGTRKAEEHGSDAHAWYELGLEALRASDLGLAEKSLLKASLLRPEHTSTWVNLGQVQGSLGKLDDAILSLQRALSTDHKSPEAHCNIGLTYLLRGSPLQAKAHFERALELKPDYVIAICNLGTLLFRLSHIQEGAQYFRRAMELSPDDPNIVEKFAKSLLCASLLEESKEVYLALQEQFPGNEKASLGLAEIAIRSKQFNEAEEILEKLLPSACESDSSRELKLRISQLRTNLKNSDKH